MIVSKFAGKRWDKFVNLIKTNKYIVLKLNFGLVYVYFAEYGGNFTPSPSLWQGEPSMMGSIESSLEFFNQNWKHRAGIFPANIYLFKVNNRNTRKICEICSKLTIVFTDFEKLNVSWVAVIIYSYWANFRLFSGAFITKPR